MRYVLKKHKKKVMIGGAVFALFFIVANSISLSNLMQNATFSIELLDGNTTVGEEGSFYLIVDAQEPINALETTISFSPETIEITDISIEDSFIDLWVFGPTFSNASGTLSFTGGTPAEGGFLGRGVVATVTYRGLAPGRVLFEFENANVLAYDGLGTPVDTESLDESIIVERLAGDQARTARTTMNKIVVRDQNTPLPDLNSDGKVSLADLSIFVTHISGDYVYKSDFNEDGEVDLKDVSILLSQMVRR